MKRKGRILIKTILGFIIATSLFLQSSESVYAITTKFDIASIEKDWTPDNCVYKSPNLNIQVCKWGYGYVADVLNTSDIDTLLAELHANASPAGHKRSILGIYMEGAGLSETNASDIANAGWTEVDLYYETFFVGGSAPTAAMRPFVTKTTDANALATLAYAGITEDVAMFEVSGVNMTWANVILYEKEFKFLKGKTLYPYKYIADLEVFVPINEAYFGSYGANFLELHGLEKAEADANGIYVVLTRSLPDNLVVSAERVPVLRENTPVTPPTEDWLSEPTEEDNHSEASVSEEESCVSQNEEVGGEQESQTRESEESDREQESREVDHTEEVNLTSSVGDPDRVVVLRVSNTEDTVEWSFADGQSPENFTAEATVKALSEIEVSVDFVYSGLLPEHTKVTVQIPNEHVKFQAGDTLYLYYCNPETEQRDFVGDGTYQENQVTFKINHCSEYVITSISPNELGEAGHGILLWLLWGAVVVVCGIGGFLIFKKKGYFQQAK